MWSLDKFFVCHCILYLLVVKHASLEKPDNPTVYNIGGVLSGNESETYFATTISVSLLDLIRLVIFLNSIKILDNFVITNRITN